MLPDSHIGEYRVLSLIGAGGMGEVYRAVHRRIDRDVAIKVLKPGYHDPRLMERFTNEARIHAGLRHPAIATLYEFMEWKGQLCIVMEYVDGHTLADRIVSRGALPLSDASRIFRDVVDAIAYVHDHGIVHRDIKPSNIKITGSGQVKLLDFGIAKDALTPNFTVTGKFIGTLQYLAPEQLSGGTADFRSDIWALGVLLYEMLTGHMPFEAADIGTLMQKISRADCFPPSAWRTELTAETDAIVARCLRKRPSERYPGAIELRRDAERCFAALGSGSIPNESTVGARQGQRFLQAIAGYWPAFSSAFALAAAVGGILYLADETEEQGPRAAQDASPAIATTSLADSVGDGPAVRTVPVTINSLVKGAEVYVDGHLVGTTPITFAQPIGRKIGVVLRKIGYRDRHLPSITVREPGHEFFEQMDRTHAE